MSTRVSTRVEELPFEARVRILEDGRGVRGDAARSAAKRAWEDQADFHRVNKHRPAEMSSKRPVPRHREVIPAAGGKPRDPRFEDSGTATDPDKFRKRYSFLYDTVMPAEASALKQRLKRTSSSAKQQEVAGVLTKVKQTLAEDKLKRRQAEVHREWKNQEATAIASGKPRFYLKKGEKKKLDLVAKYEELKAGGKLDKFMEKRRRKNAAKDHRYVPEGRR